jgi:hypothetical protein
MDADQWYRKATFPSKDHLEHALHVCFKDSRIPIRGNRI